MSTTTITCPYCEMSKSFSKDKIPKLASSITCNSCKETFPFTPSVEIEYVSTNLQGLKEVVKINKKVISVEFFSKKTRVIISSLFAFLAMLEGFVNIPGKIVLLLVFGLVPFLASYSTLGLLNIPGKAFRYTSFYSAILFFTLIFSIKYFIAPERGLSRALFSSSSSLLVIVVMLHIISWAQAGPAPLNSGN